MLHELSRLAEEWKTAIAGLRVDALPTGEVGAVLAEVVRVKNVAAAAEALLVSRAAVVAGGRGVTAVARAVGVSEQQAKRSIEVSKRLADLPTLADAARSGELSPRQVELIAPAAAASPAAQSRLVEAAKREDLQGLRKACEQVRADADPDPEARRARVHAARRVEVRTDEVTGARVGSWWMTADASAEVEAVLDGYTEAAFERARQGGRREPFAAYRADGLLAMARAAAGAGDGVRVRRELVVRVDRAALLRGHVHEGEVCELRGVGPVPVSVAREALDDAFLKGVLVDGDEVRLVRHFGRRIPVALRTALDERDPCCSEPGCNKALGTQIDHLVPYALGGPLSLGNAERKCGPSHAEKTKADMVLIRAARRRGGREVVATGGGGPPPG